MPSLTRLTYYDPPDCVQPSVCPESNRGPIRGRSASRYNGRSLSPADQVNKLSTSAPIHNYSASSRSASRYDGQSVSPAAHPSTSSQIRGHSASLRSASPYSGRSVSPAEQVSKPSPSRTISTRSRTSRSPSLSRADQRRRSITPSVQHPRRRVSFLLPAGHDSSPPVEESVDQQAPEISVSITFPISCSRLAENSPDLPTTRAEMQKPSRNRGVVRSISNETTYEAPSLCRCTLNPFSRG